MGAILSTNRESQDRRSLCVPCRSVCYKCNVPFETKMSLKQHMEEVHAETSYTCDYCNSISSTWFTFEQHIYGSHNNMIFCTYCYKAYSDYSNFRLHWRTHEPFECERCKDTFVTVKNLLEHCVATHRKISYLQMFFQLFRR
ncbi:PREDICTED: zinc finger protein 77-like [Trachymyrmex septentrionalis]|uniref:zinc finger protein 77-like n=1 Tax=Trachymyrmex septentrionalis TaxID=34720 RepID=UPI00084EEBA3|nr:PREDICTED: zinc finger protein 77-like [Trachymyrmex septentrionalis]